MAEIGIRLHHELNVSQQLNLAPQLLQWLRLLHVPTTELTTLVQQELESNPALEVAEYDLPNDTGLEKAEPDGETAERSAQDDEWQEKQDFLVQLEKEWGEDSASEAISHAGRDAADQERHNYLMDTAVSAESLYERLMKQLPLADLAPTEIAAAELAIGSLDARGYLTLTATELADRAGVSPQGAERAIACIQAMEPAGVGARDLRECLLLQMDDEPADSLPRLLTDRYLDAVARKQYRALAEILDVEPQDIEVAVARIAALDPAPGESFSVSPAQVVEADVVLERDNDGWRVVLNDDRLPRLRISAACRRLLERRNLTPAEAEYVRNKIRAATFLIQGIGQRQDTLRKVSEQIARFQNTFLSSNRGELKPLTMAKLAAMIGVHETTVCRALANKYIQTPRGMFEMKHFFRSGYACADGSAMTPDQVKRVIRSLIAEENPTSPRRDSDLVLLLKKRGLDLARRTIAKYREEMDIPSSKERKKRALLKFERTPFTVGGKTTDLVTAVA